MCSEARSISLLSRKHYISVKFRKSKLRERNKELSFLIEMSDFLSSSVNLKEFLVSAFSKVMEHFDLDAGRIYLMDEDGRHLSLAACQRTRHSTSSLSVTTVSE